MPLRGFSDNNIFKCQKNILLLLLVLMQHQKNVFANTWTMLLQSMLIAEWNASRTLMILFTFVYLQKMTYLKDTNFVTIMTMIVRTCGGEKRYVYWEFLFWKTISILDLLLHLPSTDTFTVFSNFVYLTLGKFLCVHMSAYFYNDY